MLLNRLLWLAIGAATARLHARAVPAGRAAGGRPRPPGRKTHRRAARAARCPARRRSRSAPSALAQLPGLIWLSFRETVKSVYFLVIALAGVLFVVVTARMSGLIYGTATYPVTRSMIELAGGSFGMFIIIIVIIYSGELVWREREARIDQIVDAAPFPTWLLHGCKLGALLLVGLVLQLLVMGCGLGIQIARGYDRFELPLYFFDLLGLRMVGYFQLAALALFVQVLVNHKHLGQFVMVLYFVVDHPAAHRGVRAQPLPLRRRPRLRLFGHEPLRPLPGAVGLVQPLLVALRGLLVVLSNLLWVRGQETRLRHRLRLAVARSRRARPGGAGGVLLLGFAGHRRVHLLQHQHPQPVPDRRPTASASGRTTSGSTSATRRSPSRASPTCACTSISGRRRAPCASRAPTGSRTRATADPGDPRQPRHGREDSRARRGRARAPHAARTTGWTSTASSCPSRWPRRPGHPGLRSRIQPRGGSRTAAPGAVVVANGTFIHSTYLPLLGYHAQVRARRRRRSPQARPAAQAAHGRPGRPGRPAAELHLGATRTGSPSPPASAPRPIRWRSSPAI